MLKEEFNEKYKDFFEGECSGIEIDFYEETVSMLDNIFTEFVKIPEFKLLSCKVNENGELEFLTNLNPYLSEMIMINIVGYEEYYAHKNLGESEIDEIEFEELKE